MARGVNKVILIGNLGQDPELTYTPNGLAVAKFSLATTDNRKTQEGEWEEQTEWHRIVLFGKTAETAGQFLSKGKQVFIEGRIHYNTYEKDGVKRYYTDIIGFNFQMLGRREEGAPQGPSEGPPPHRPAPSEPEMPEGDAEEDLPF